MLYLSRFFCENKVIYDKIAGACCKIMNLNAVFTLQEIISGIFSLKTAYFQGIFHIKYKYYIMLNGSFAKTI